MESQTRNGLRPLEPLARALSRAVPERPRDDGLFGPRSVVWRLHRDRSFPVAGIRSLLLQALHPLAMAGVAQHSEWRRDPLGRLAATSGYVLTLTYGERQAAETAAARVRVHAHVRGIDPESGLAHSAEDPALLLWVHAAMVDSILCVAKRYGRRLAPDDPDRYVAEMVPFVFRGLYRLRAFNGDPHPGNYLFHGGGGVSFLDYGLTRRFTREDVAPLEDAVRYIAVDRDGEGFRAALERPGFLQRGAPVATDVVVDHLGAFYGTILRDAPLPITPAYASAMVRRFFDTRSPLAPYSNIPRQYIVLQRINLGLYGVLGSLHATGNWRRIAEEIWPFVDGPPSTPIGEAEARWARARERSGASTTP